MQDIIDTNQSSDAARRSLQKEQDQDQVSLASNSRPLLPLELVYRILRIAASIITDFNELKGPAGKQRKRLLCSASLVCRLWRDEAQKLLWECVTVRRDEGGRSFLLSNDVGRQSEVLVVSPEEDQLISASLVAEVLVSSPGIKGLSLAGIRRATYKEEEEVGFDTAMRVPDVLSSPMLAGELRAVLFSPSWLLHLQTSSASSYSDRLSTRVP